MSYRGSHKTARACNSERKNSCKDKRTKMDGESTKDAGTRQESKEDAAPSGQDPHEADFSEIFSIRTLIRDVINGASI